MLKIPALEVTLKTVQRDLLSELRWFGVPGSFARSTTLGPGLRLLKSLSDMVVDLAKDPCVGSDFENDSVRSIERVAVV